MKTFHTRAFFERNGKLRELDYKIWPRDFTICAESSDRLREVLRQEYQLHLEKEPILFVSREAKQ